MWPHKLPVCFYCAYKMDRSHNFQWAWAMNLLVGFSTAQPNTMLSTRTSQKKQRPLHISREDLRQPSLAGPTDKSKAQSSKIEEGPGLLVSHGLSPRGEGGGAQGATPTTPSRPWLLARPPCRRRRLESRASICWLRHWGQEVARGVWELRRPRCLG